MSDAAAPRFDESDAAWRARRKGLVKADYDASAATPWAVPAADDIIFTGPRTTVTVARLLKEVRHWFPGWTQDRPVDLRMRVVGDSYITEMRFIVASGANSEVTISHRKLAKCRTVNQYRRLVYEKIEAVLKDRGWPTK
jgi:hypothetical protein